MPYSVERGDNSPESKVSVTEQEFKLPDHLKKDGIEAVETAFKANVKGDDGSALTQSSGSGASMNPPADTKTLLAWAKGPITNALTWFANFWLRMIKKAKHGS